MPGWGEKMLFRASDVASRAVWRGNGQRMLLRMQFYALGPPLGKSSLARRAYRVQKILAPTREATARQVFFFPRQMFSPGGAPATNDGQARSVRTPLPRLRGEFAQTSCTQRPRNATTELTSRNRIALPAQYARSKSNASAFRRRPSWACHPALRRCARVGKPYRVRKNTPAGMRLGGGSHMHARHPRTEAAHWIGLALADLPSGRKDL